jgi:AcrR family transcriptional regulator
MATTRDEQKLRTRAGVIDAARRLFADPGYDKTTARQLAEAAEVGVGSIFTTFDSMEEILAEIVIERYDALAEAVGAALADARGGVRERLKLAFATAYRFEAPRHAMLMHQLAASWTWSAEFEAKSQARLARPFGFVFALLREGKDQGEIAAAVDVAEAADMLLGMFLRNFRHGWYQKLGVEGMIGRMSAQIDLLFDGARQR